MHSILGQVLSIQIPLFMALFSYTTTFHRLLKEQMATSHRRCHTYQEDASQARRTLFMGLLAKHLIFHLFHKEQQDKISLVLVTWQRTEA